MEINIHTAIKNQRLTQIKEALSKNRESINQIDPKLGWTPLYKATLYGNIEIIKCLLDNQCDVNQKISVLLLEDRRDRAARGHFVQLKQHCFLAAPVQRGSEHHGQRTAYCRTTPLPCTWPAKSKVWTACKRCSNMGRTPRCSTP